MQYVLVFFVQLERVDVKAWDPRACNRQHRKLRRYQVEPLIPSRFISVCHDVNSGERIVIAELNLHLVVGEFHVSNVDRTDPVRFQESRLSNEYIPLLFPFDD